MITKADRQLYKTVKRLRDTGTSDEDIINFLIDNRAVFGYDDATKKDWAIDYMKNKIFKITEEDIKAYDQVIHDKIDSVSVEDQFKKFEDELELDILGAHEFRMIVKSAFFAGYSCHLDNVTDIIVNHTKEHLAMYLKKGLNDVDNFLDNEYEPFTEKLNKEINERN